jgi:hypothetical protein
VSVLRVLAVIVGLVVACTACGTSTAGAPTAAPGSSAAAPTTSSRPRDIKIDGVDPCSLLTTDVRTELGFKGQPERSASPSSLYGGQVDDCGGVGSTPARAVGVGIALVTSTGIERFADPTLRLRTVPAETAGFPALVVYPERFTDFCMIAVDVAPGQLIEVQFSDIKKSPPIPQDELCRSGLRIAEAGMRYLLAH